MSAEAQIADKNATIRRLKEKLESVEPFVPTVDGWKRLMAVIPPDNGISVAEGAVRYIQKLEQDLSVVDNAAQNWQDIKVSKNGETHALGTLIPLLESQIVSAERQRDNWMETASQHSRNQEFYHGLVTDIGNMFGLVARVADDGTICEDVLALKVPELVAKLIIKSEETL